VCDNSRVLTLSHKRKAYVKSPENREWVSIVECVSAAGRKLRPVVISKRQSLQTSWINSESVLDWLCTTSENGWTSNSLGVEWLRCVFIPDTPRIRRANRLLILDGHGSHVSTEFMWACYREQIHCFYLPTHSSHVLQLLDLALSPPQRRCNSQERALHLSIQYSSARRFIRAGYTGWVACCRPCSIQSIACTLVIPSTDTANDASISATAKRNTKYDCYNTSRVSGSLQGSPSNRAVGKAHAEYSAAAQQGGQGYFTGQYARS
jgi:hypothetical protein